MDINIKLNKNFTSTFNHLVNEYGEEMTKLNGFADVQIGYTEFIDNFIDKTTVADASIDGSSNVSHKDIVTLLNEMNKPHGKLLAFNKIFYELNKKYGFKTAKKWLEREWDGHYYLHDAYSSTFVPYCYAYDLEDLATKGLYFIEDFNHQPPEHLTTFTDFVGEFVSYACNRTSGAVGLPNFLVYSFYFWKKDVERGYYLVSPEYYRDQSFQEIVYRLNQPFLRSGIQSAFTNFSIFDRPYYEALFGGKEFPDGTFMIDYMDEFMEYQKAFMAVVSEIRTVNLCTFPVLTFSLLRKDGKFVDEEFAKWACRHNMKWADSNFFVSEDVTSLSNCCFSGDTTVWTMVDNKWARVPMKDLYTNGKDVILTLGRYRDPKEARVIRMPARKMFKIMMDSGKEIVATDNHIWPTTLGLATTSSLKAGYGLVVTHRSQETGKADYFFRYIKEVYPVEYNDEYVYCLEMLDQTDPYFTLGNDILTHNCRLVSDIKNLGYFNSIGGTALRVGSIKVNTINLARLSYENATPEAYLEALPDIVTNCLQTLDVVRLIIKRNIEKGLLPNYTRGLIDINTQYNTIGIIGIYEALQKYSMTYKDEFGNTFYTDEGVEFAKAILAKITEVKNEFGADKDYQINIEEVPAERCAAVLMEKDQLLFPDELYELPLYGNQWIPLAVKTTLQEKVRLSAILDKACSGGSIAHINIEAPFNNFETAWNMLNYVADAGVVYFAFNLRISACEMNHGFYGDTCPTCGKPVSTTYQRVVGFIVPATSYSSQRKKEFAKRTWLELDQMRELG